MSVYQIPTRNTRYLPCCVVIIPQGVSMVAAWRRILTNLNFLAGVLSVQVRDISVVIAKG